MVEVFRAVRRVLRKDGTLWLNLGDCYHNGDKGGYQASRVKAEDSLQRSLQSILRRVQVGRRFRGRRG